MTVRRSFDIIGTRYSSKKEFDDAVASGDVFKGKIYASYNNRQTYKTYYFRNDVLADEIFGPLLPKKSSVVNSCADLKVASHLDKYKSNHIEPHISNFLQNVRHRDEQNVRRHNEQNVRHLSHVQALEQINTYKNNLPLDVKGAWKKIFSLCTEEEIKVGRMIKIFNEIVGGCCIERISKKTLFQALDSLKFNFNDSLEEWEKHCVDISSSSFLMGETKSEHFKKIVFKWAFSRDFIDKLTSGHYQRDREKILKKKIDALESQAKEQNAVKKHHEGEEDLVKFKGISSELSDRIKIQFEDYLQRPNGARHGIARNLLNSRGKTIWEEIFEQNWQSAEKSIFLHSLKEFLVTFFENEQEAWTKSPSLHENECAEINKHKEDLARINKLEQESSNFSIFEGDKRREVTASITEVSNLTAEKHFSSMKEKASLILRNLDNEDIIKLRLQYGEHVTMNDPIARELIVKLGWDDPVLNLLFENYITSYSSDIHEGSSLVH